MKAITTKTVKTTETLIKQFDENGAEVVQVTFHRRDIEAVPYFRECLTFLYSFWLMEDRNAEANELANKGIQFTGIMELLQTIENTINQLFDTVNPVEETTEVLH